MTIRNTLIWTTSVIGAGAVLALVIGALERPVAMRTISVTGECLTTVPKDRTAITLRVTTLDDSAAVSMKMATAKIAEITAFLKTQDVEMQTTEFNSYEKTEWNRETQKSDKLGIETTIAVEVSADNIEIIEKILTQFAGQPNVYSENLRMYTSAAAMKPALEKCLGAATENARVRADALAVGDNRTAGQLLNVSYDTASSHQYQPMPTNFYRGTAKLESAAAMDAAGSIVAKDTEVSVRVSATFEIK